MIVELSNVTVLKGEGPILAEVTWQVRPGEHWALLGPNGSGKTTLLSLLTGYLWPSRGRVRVLGETLGQIDVRQLRRAIGWVSSAAADWLAADDLPVEEIVLGGAFSTIGLYDPVGPEHLERAKRLLEQAGAQGLARRRYATLSQGERQRVLIARALMSAPRLLILDEPCTGLDPVARHDLLRAVEAMGQQPHGPALVYVTHHVEEVLPVLGHTLLLSRGRTCALGPTERVLTGENLSRCFERPVNLSRQAGRYRFQLAD